MLDRPFSDPLSAAVTLLRPQSVQSNIVSGAGDWAVHYSAYGQPSFCLMLEGMCWLSIRGLEPRTIEKGDFFLLPTTPEFTMASSPEALPLRVCRSPSTLPVAEVRHGDMAAEAEMVMVAGSFAFGSGNAELLLSILPPSIPIRATDPDVGRLALLVELISAEAAASLQGRDSILIRAVEIMLIDALRTRSPGDVSARKGLLAGLDDVRLAKALRALHADVRRRWTVADLARAAGMSRAAFSAKFSQTVGLSPMDYLLQWRIALAKDLLRHQHLPLAEVALAVGYQSASAFSSAFSRSVGTAPSLFARSPEFAESRPVPPERYAVSHSPPHPHAQAA